MIQHVVLFAFGSHPEGMTKEEFLLQAKDSFEELADLIDPLEKITVTININPNEEYDLMLHGVLGKYEHVEVYAKHPEHVSRVQKWIKPYVSKRACIDGELLF